MCQPKLLKYYTPSADLIVNSTQFPVDPLCNGWIVKNNGTTNVIVNGDTLLPTESKAIGGNYMEVYAGRIDISFPGGPAAGNLLTLTQKVYINVPVELLNC